jgi:hypothetical protein
MTYGGAIMPRARIVAKDATIDLKGLPATVGFADPFEALLDRVRPAAARSVDALQLTAWLEANGMTDRAAKVEFGYADVFELAEEIFQRVGGAIDSPARVTSLHRASQLRDVGHGALYLLPATVFPAVFALLGRQTLVVWVVLAAAICWVWSGATAWLAYRLLGGGRPRSAGAMLRWSSLVALPVIALAALAVSSATGVGLGLVAIAVVQMAYQMAATALVFYHREGLAVASMMPAATAGICYLIASPSLLPVAIWLCVGSIAFTFVLAIHETVGRGTIAEPPLRQSLRGQFRPLCPVVAFTGLSAAFFLYPQVPYLHGRFDITIAFLPVIIGMGVVEWRAHRFGDDVHALLARVAHVGQFTVQVRLLVLRGLGICLVTVSALAVVLLAALAWTGRLSAAGAVMAASGVLLAGAYFLGFLLANMGRYGWLCGSLLICLGVYSIGVAVTARGALSGTTAFLAATSLLVGLYLAALAGSVGQASRHR